MSQIVREIIIVILLTLLNGFFACSEIALISIRKTLVQNLAEKGSRRAKIIRELQRDPERMFATLQVGISVITVLTSAFAGSRIAEQVAEPLARSSLPFVASNAYGIAFTLVVILISYISVTLGELVPKSLGLRYAENFALFAAFPIWWLSKLTRWPVQFLKLSANLFLKPFRDSTNFIESRLSEEELRTLLNEGRRAGAIEGREHEMLENVFDFADLTVGKIVIPRTRMTAFDINDSAEHIVRNAVDSGYSRVPIYRDTLNTIVGILYTKELLHLLGKDLRNLDLEKLLLPPYFVPNTMKITEVLQKLQRKKMHMALVTDEHGEIEGLVTLEDILEEIVGDIADETDEANKTIVKHPEGFLVSGEVSIVDFNHHFGSELPEDQDFTTISGFILDRLERFPEQGDKVIHDSLEIIVHEKTDRTVKTALVKKAPHGPKE